MPTPNLNLPYLAVGQSNKEQIHNLALVYLDILVQARVLAIELEPPVGPPADGDAYIVGDPADGLWTDHEGEIVFWFEALGVWTFIVPKAGWRVFNVDTGSDLFFDGDAWTPVSTDGVTASNTQSQAGATALVGDFSRITTCAIVLDAVGLPAAIAGRSHGILNNGDQDAEVWPKVAGDAIDDEDPDDPDPTGLASGEFRQYHCFTTGVWRTLFNS